MLAELRIRNVAVIDSVTLSLSAGFNVLTGETGAGKSLIVGALGLLLGERAAADRIREGADRASAEGVFIVPESHAVLAALDARGIDTELQHESNDSAEQNASKTNTPSESFVVILKREVSQNGRSRAWINGSPVTASVLAEIGAMLVSVHGQHESHSLVEAEHQRDILDSYIGAEELRRKIKDAYNRAASYRATEQQLEARRSEALRRSDYLRFVLNEIETAALQFGEDEQLDAAIRKLSHAGELQQLAGDASLILAGDEQSVLIQLAALRRSLAGLVRLDSDTQNLQTVFDNATYALEELAREVSNYAESVEVDPAQLQQLETRRDLVMQLMRKYGPSISDVTQTANEAASELSQFENDDSQLAQIQQDIKTATAELETAAQELTVLRAQGARKFGNAVSQYFPQLGIADGKMEVRLADLNQIGPNGAESVQFEVALNGGDSLHALGKIASGGELSRVMLAMSTVLSRLQEVPTLVFDEVDAGVGGAIAWQVGALMRNVAQHHQVLAISHLAQIASQANTHIVVHKSAVGTVTTADTRTVDGEDRVLEIARMLGGDAHREVSRAHARELLSRSDSVAVAESAEPSDSATPVSQPSSKSKAARPQRRGKPV